MENFPGNSIKSQKTSYTNPPRAESAPETEEKVKKVDRIVTGEVIQRKKPLGKRFMSTFFGGDAKSAATHVFEHVIISSVRDLVANSLEAGINQMIYGDSRPRGGGVNVGSALVSGLGKFSYDRISSGPAPKSGGLLGRSSPDTRNELDLNEIILNSKIEADLVLEKMFQLLQRYDVVTVGDLYDMLGVSTRNFMVNQYGWKSLMTARVTRTRGGGYLLVLPDPEHLGH